MLGGVDEDEEGASNVCSDDFDGFTVATSLTGSLSLELGMVANVVAVIVSV